MQKVDKLKESKVNSLQTAINIFPIPKLSKPLTDDLIKRIKRVGVVHILEEINRKSYFCLMLFNCKYVYFKEKEGNLICEVRSKLNLASKNI